ncbi:hypothetical protein EPIR_1291 [Erwinia piriflorinigrans CFBP 5888]|uniref:Uncharacterized protein n=1 Tax=Erwinia piriflorinigrans CFBP 5888 TaxID=1161919 RepID=V5Z5P9_9GAMM|nr:hypothetical protein EPIR_1291 [Erwinia piriflorinigrans CFBP 5888]
MSKIRVNLCINQSIKIDTQWFKKLKRNLPDVKG